MKANSNVLTWLSLTLLLLAIIPLPHAHAAPPPDAATVALVAAPTIAPAADTAPPHTGFLALCVVALSVLALGSIRTIVDAQLIRTVNLPAASGTASTPSIQLGTGPHTDDVEGRLTVPATPNLADAKTLTVTIEDSADDITFAPIDVLATFVRAGAGGIGAAAFVQDFRFPSHTREYVRATVVAEAAAGDSTDLELEFTLLL